MKRSLLLVVVLGTACSRSPSAESSWGNEDARPVLHVGRISAQPTRWPEEYPSHFFDVDGGAWITAGDPPSADHRAGTVYVLEAPETGHFSLAEWDLAAGTALRRRPVPFDPGILWGDSQILHEGDRIHIAARGAGTNVTYYGLLDTSFRVLAKSPLDQLRAQRARSLASDGTLTLVVGMVPSGIDSTAGEAGYAYTFDSRGQRIAGRRLPFEPNEYRLLEDCAAVVNGTPYLLRREGAALRLQQLTPNLEEIISTTIPVESDAWGQPTLRAQGDRLIVDVAPQQFELSADLTHLQEVPRRPPRTPRDLDGLNQCRSSAIVGPLYALLCAPVSGPRFIAWDLQER